MRKPDFCLCENKGADQLRGSFAVTVKLISAFVFATRIVNISSSSYIPNFKLLACFCDCTGQFVSDLVGNPEDRFSRVAAQLSYGR